MNIQLKVALVERGQPAYKTAIEADLHPNKLSKFTTGIQEPTQNEKNRLAEILGRSADELFPQPNLTESNHTAA